MQFGQQVLTGETGSATEKIDAGSGEWLALEISVLDSGAVTITAGVNGATAIGLKAALTDVVAASAAATGLWYAFIAPYSNVVVSGTGLVAGDTIWVGVQ